MTADARPRRAAAVAAAGLPRPRRVAAARGGAGAPRVRAGRRSTPAEEAVALARAVVADPGLRLVGVMAYEGQVAGLPDRPSTQRFRGPALREVKRRSVAELAQRRAEVVAAVREVADLELVNGGGTGSLETTSAEAAVTEVAAGSGLFSPALFDGYDAFRGRPAAFFALDVTRRPGPGLVTVAGRWLGGVRALRGVTGCRCRPGRPGCGCSRRRAPARCRRRCAGRAADRLAVGDRVWFRHAKAGELGEHVAVLHLVGGDGVRGGARPTGARGSTSADGHPAA